ncbi:LytR/AlgR family response regulator transcription factor [Spirosoma panaciterrae]|uniref:LytR/AlgR family response regulator transcription factor n=1 Tax=Spirosoma panaciterrae TaxID=496058 RepID=UPI000376D3BD|nr:LytTR family DNA-binding domain-containing protein [Spirosoma panaciterrae]
MKLSSISEPKYVNNTWSLKMLISWTIVGTLYNLTFNGLFNAMMGRLNTQDSRWLLWFILNISCTPVAIVFVGLIVFKKWNTIWKRPIVVTTDDDKKAVVIVQIKILIAIYLVNCLLAIIVNSFFNIIWQWAMPLHLAIGFSMPAVAFYFYNNYILEKNNLFQLEGKPINGNVVASAEKDIISESEKINKLNGTHNSDILLSPANRVPIISPQQEFIKFMEYDRDVLQLLPNQIYAIQSQGNYVLIFWHNKGEKLEKTLLRINISLVEELLVNYPLFMRTHRSFIVNLQKVRHIEGNTRKLHLQIALLDYDVLVARTKVDEFRRRMDTVS